jgi:signal transduction histidine kinase
MVSALTGLAVAWLTQRSPNRRAAAWVLAVAGPVAVTLALYPFRSSLSLGGFLFCLLVLVLADAAIGGTWSALTTVAAGAVAGGVFYNSAATGLEFDLFSLVVFVIVGAAGAVLIGELAQVAGQQASSGQAEAVVRRVATLVARGAPADELFAAVAEEVGRLHAADYARLARYEPGDMLTIMSTWTRAGLPFVRRRVSLEGENVSSMVLRTGQPARIDDFVGATGPLAEEARAHGVRCTIGAPVVVEGRIWGVMTVGAIQKWTPPPDIAARLASFTDLLATAISNAESRAAVTRLAEEQAALRRVATLVARGAPADELFAAVPAEAGQLLRADRTTMCRYEPDGTLTVIAGWSKTGHPYPIGQRPPLGGDNLATIVFETRRPARMDCYAGASGPIAALISDGRLRSGVATPIIVRDHLWGVIVANSTKDRPLPPGTEDRLASFTDLVATAISNAENLAELTASRARVVAAADETRRRIERDLHDGAQQRLISLGLALRSAQQIVPPQLGPLQDELAQVADGLASVHDDLREMARGIHPAILARGGLGPALKTLARRSAVPVELGLRAEIGLPEPVEVAAYYVVAEALANAAKHARASVIHVDADADPDGNALRLCVRDDGAGGADPARGSGLVGLKDRVEALGGTLTLHSPPGAGTALRVELPLADLPPLRPVADQRQLGAKTLIPASCNARDRPAWHHDRMPLRCLLVDDNLAFLGAATVLLEREGLTVAGTATNSAEALRQAEELRPDVILVDIGLGKESGFDVARLLARSGQGNGATVILISARAEADYAELIADSPAAGFLPKSELSAPEICRVLGATP